MFGVPALHFPECIDVDPQINQVGRWNEDGPAWRFKQLDEDVLNFPKKQLGPSKNRGF